MPAATGAVKQVDVTQVVFLVDPDASSLFARALWEAANEAADFYGVAGGWSFPHASVPVRVEPAIDTRLLSSAVPAGVPREAVTQDAEAVERGVATATVSKGLAKQDVLGPLVHETLALQGSSIVITDCAIVPPAEWRYIIWDATPNGAVISYAPLDPGYWTTAVEADERIMTVKSRVRAAALCVIGSLTGLRRCQNERCFMFANIDSVVRLDQMELIGPEHEIPELSERRVVAQAEPG